MSNDRRRDGIYSSLFPFACCTALSGATWYLSRVVWRDHVDAVQRAPRMTIRELDDRIRKSGEKSVWALVQGQSHCPRPLRSPYAGEECCFYHSQFTFLHRVNFPASARTPTFLMDASGRAKIATDPKRYPLPAVPAALGLTNDVLTVLGLGREEHVLRPGEDMFVVGHFERAPDAAPAGEEGQGAAPAPAELRIVPPTGWSADRAHQPVVFGLYTPEQHVQDKRWESWALFAMSAFVGAIGLIPLYSAYRTAFPPSAPAGSGGRSGSADGAPH